MLADAIIGDDPGSFINDDDGGPDTHPAGVPKRSPPNSRGRSSAQLARAWWQFVGRRKLMRNIEAPSSDRFHAY